MITEERNLKVEPVLEKITQKVWEFENKSRDENSLIY